MVGGVEVGPELWKVYDPQRAWVEGSFAESLRAIDLAPDDVAHGLDVRVLDSSEIDGIGDGETEARRKVHRDRGAAVRLDLPDETGRIDDRDDYKGIDRLPALKAAVRPIHNRPSGAAVAKFPSCESASRPGNRIHEHRRQPIAGEVRVAVDALIGREGAALCKQGVDRLPWPPVRASVHRVEMLRDLYER